MAEKEYIERDKILQKISKMIEYCKKDNKVNGLTALFQVGDAIIDCKSADVQEVKHGKNTIECIPVDKFKCSECGFEIHGFSQPVHDIDGYCKYITECYFNYCPHCGARMDGDENAKTNFRKP